MTFTWIWRIIICILVPLHGRGITKEASLGNALVRTKREKKGERALSNNHNVMLGCVIQKKSFSLGGGARDLS